MEKLHKIIGLYISSLRAIALIHQMNHWHVKGANFYGSHLLFQRLYESALENVDLAAEKFIGLFGDECMNYETQVEFLRRVMLKYQNLEGSPFEQSLEIEKDFVKFSKDAYHAFEESNQLSLGLDDMIMAIASSREEAIYLLQQSLKNQD